MASIAADDRPTLTDLTSDHRLAIACAISTAVIHGYVGFARKNGITELIFLLAALGFLGGILLFYVGSATTRKRVYIAGIGYTALQFCLYFLVNWPHDIDVLGIVDKLVQLGLIALLLALYKETPLLVE